MICSDPSWGIIQEQGRFLFLKGSKTTILYNPMIANKFYKGPFSPFIDQLSENCWQPYLLLYFTCLTLILLCFLSQSQINPRCIRLGLKGLKPSASTSISESSWGMSVNGQWVVTLSIIDKYPSN